MISIFFVRVSYIQTGGLTWMSQPTNPMGVGREFLRMSGIGILDQPLGDRDPRDPETNSKFAP